MLPRIRHEHILREVRLHGAARSAELAERLGVNLATIRRDIAELDAAGLVSRVHGGALSVEKSRTRPAHLRPLIGLLVPTRTSYFPDVIRGMERLAAARGVRLILGVSNYDQESERARIDNLIRLGVQGLLLAPTVRDDAAGVAGYLATLSLPLVLIERLVEGLEATTDREFEHVRTDHVHGAALAVRHLARLGHRRIGLVTYDRTPTAPWLQAGYLQAVERFGVESQGVFPVSKGEDGDQLECELDAVLRETLAAGTTAVIVHTDYHASRLAELAVVRGIAIPGDLAIIAYDDEFAESALIPLTAVTAPRLEVGKTALSLLVDRLERRDDLDSIRHISLLPRLTIRRSCGGRTDD